MDRQDLVGTVLAERFRIEGSLGEGAMGHVYVAKHEVLGRLVAVKVLHQFVADDPRLVERFRREARTASNLDHPNIVGITDFGRTDEDQLYLVMEYIPGFSLQEAIRVASPGRLPFPKVLSILAQICRAVECAREAGIVHRDLKPDNVLLGKGRSGQEVVKILDFGLAKMMDAPELSRLTRQGEVFGTPAYMSPEQARGDAVDHRADIYSVGVMAYELLSGRLPFQYASILQILRAHQGELPQRPSVHVPSGEWAIPTELEDLVMRCLEKVPAERPSDLSELLSVVESYQQRFALGASRIIPRVVLQQSPEEIFDPSQDWCEVTCEYTSVDAVSVTLPGDVQVGTTLQGVLVKDSMALEVDAPPNAPATWYWSRVITKAKALAQHLRDQRLGSIELTREIASLAELEDRNTGLLAEIALAQSRIDDLDALTREAETRLRRAVLDLSVERGRLVDEGSAAPKVIQDLDAQIRALEGRIAEVHRQRVEKLGALEKAIDARQQHVDHYQQALTAGEARLLNLLHRVQPRPCPQDIQAAYDRIEVLIRAMQNAQA